MNETRRGDFLRSQAAADAIAPIKQEDVAAPLAEYGGSDEAVDPPANDHIVDVRHAARLGRHEGQCTDRGSGAIDKLQRRRDQHCALGRKLVELTEARQTVAISFVH